MFWAQSKFSKAFLSSMNNESSWFSEQSIIFNALHPTASRRFKTLLEQSSVCKEWQSLISKFSNWRFGQDRNCKKSIWFIFKEESCVNADKSMELSLVPERFRCER